MKIYFGGFADTKTHLFFKRIKGGRIYSFFYLFFTLNGSASEFRKFIGK